MKFKGKAARNFAAMLADTEALQSWLKTGSAEMQKIAKLELARRGKTPEASNETQPQ